jgi:uncharacterized membrane protein YeaQ/YmgE (transglycosylase-associated protein family)
VGIISWIVLGLIAGAIAKLLMPGRDPGGCILTLFHVQLGTFFDLRTWVLAILGALVILVGYRLIIGRPSEP